MQNSPTSDLTSGVKSVDSVSNDLSHISLDNSCAQMATTSDNSMSNVESMGFDSLINNENNRAQKTSTHRICVQDLCISEVSQLNLHPSGNNNSCVHESKVHVGGIDTVMHGEPTGVNNVNANVCNSNGINQETVGTAGNSGENCQTEAGCESLCSDTVHVEGSFMLQIQPMTEEQVTMETASREESSQWTDTASNENNNDKTAAVEIVYHPDPNDNNKPKTSNSCNTQEQVAGEQKDTTDKTNSSDTGTKRLGNGTGDVKDSENVPNKKFRQQGLELGRPQHTKLTWTLSGGSSEGEGELEFDDQPCECDECLLDAEPDKPKPEPKKLTTRVILVLSRRCENLPYGGTNKNVHYRCS